MWEFIFGFLFGKHQSTYAQNIDDDAIIYIPPYFYQLEHYGSLRDDDEDIEIVCVQCFVQLLVTDNEKHIYIQREKFPSAHFTRTCYGAIDAELWRKELQRRHPGSIVKKEPEFLWINVLKENKEIVLQVDKFKYEGAYDYAKCLDKVECQKLLIRARNHYEEFCRVETRYMNLLKYYLN